jgi:ribosomal protein S4|tara:strand:+ start:542 stop:1213 length:672 start_codon:yes stop_codon:yes gene_type:complete
MNNHKTRPRLKRFVKTAVFTNLKNHKKLLSKNQNIRFFSPDFVYLNSKFSDRVKDEFQTSLLNKRKLKLFFGFQRTALLKKYLHKNLYKKKSSQCVLREINFCSRLERRLDFLIFRLGFVKTLFEAKHLIAHKKVFINNVANKSYTRILKKGDIISFDSSIKHLLRKRLSEELSERKVFFDTFDNFEINFKTFKAIVLAEKIDLAKQLQHYSFSLNWKSILKR